MLKLTVLTSHIYNRIQMFPKQLKLRKKEFYQSFHQVVEHNWCPRFDRTFSQHSLTFPTQWLNHVCHRLINVIALPENIAIHVLNNSYVDFIKLPSHHHLSLSFAISLVTIVPGETKHYSYTCVRPTCVQLSHVHVPQGPVLSARGGVRHSPGRRSRKHFTEQQQAVTEQTQLRL